MKKIALMVAAAAAIFVAVPASAQTVVIRAGDGVHRHHGAHHHHRGWNSRAEWRHRRHYHKHHHRHGVRRGGPAIVITR